MTPSPSPEHRLPSTYRSKQAFLSLPPWRQLLAKFNCHPTVELKVQRYAIEQRLKRLQSEIEQLDELNSKLVAMLASPKEQRSYPAPAPTRPHPRAHPTAPRPDRLPYGIRRVRLIKCMACAIPVIASPVGANVDAVPPSCGFLASSADQWLSTFRQLAVDPSLRHRMGAAGRQWVEERYSLRGALPVLTDVIRDMFSGSPA